MTKSNVEPAGAVRLIDHDNLEAYADAEGYDREDSSETGFAFYAALAEETGGPVLEIACGTGRVSIPIAHRGYDVTGLDIVPGMLELARQKSVGLRTRWVEGDARSFDLRETFQLVFLTGNSFQAFLTRPDQEAMLNCARAHLGERGLLAFETRNPRWRRFAEVGQGRLPASSWEANGLFAYLESCDEEVAWGRYTDRLGREVRVSKTQTYDHVHQILHWSTYRRWWEGNREKTQITRIAVRYTFPQELEALLHYNGFEIIRQYGDWDLQPFSDNSPSMIVVCRKRRRAKILGEPT